MRHAMSTNFHLANLFETVADAYPDRAAIIACHEDRPTDTRTWGELDERASRIASLLVESGLKPQSKFGIYMRNRAEYIEAHLAGFKARMVPINVNYRYQADELVYLLDNADAKAVFFQEEFAPRITEIREKLPKVGTYVQVSDSGASRADWALDYEQVLASASPMARIERPSADVYMLYTGGTTGMPKGVMYSQGEFTERLSLGLMLRGVAPPTSLDQVPGRIEQLAGIEATNVSLCACPLMHGTGIWLGHIAVAYLGGATLTMSHPRFDADTLWQLAEAHAATDIVIVGDAFAKPMLKALQDAAERGQPYNISSVKRMVSSGVMWSREVKDALLEFGEMYLMDAFGSSEGGMGMSVASRGAPVETAKFMLTEGVKVFDEHDKPVEPGSDVIGMVGISGGVPLGYYKDEVKSAKTFRDIDGVRYSFPGDFAKVEADGSLTLLGRGSNCINTGGEKVFPEEVEEALKRHPGVLDCLVVGVADDRFGERIVGVVSLTEASNVSADELIADSRAHLSSFKLPRQVIFVDQVQRAVNGKADYAWAKRVAEGSPE